MPTFIAMVISFLIGKDRTMNNPSPPVGSSALYQKISPTWAIVKTFPPIGYCGMPIAECGYIRAKGFREYSADSTPNFNKLLEYAKTLPTSNFTVHFV
jgi:hypothetical protein